MEGAAIGAAWVTKLAVLGDGVAAEAMFAWSRSWRCAFFVRLASRFASAFKAAAGLGVLLAVTEGEGSLSMAGVKLVCPWP